MGYESLMLLSTKYSYYGGQFYWWGKAQVP
jgi:hypothetical protein